MDIIQFSIVTYGFNNPDEEWDKKEIEYLIVGDSMLWEHA